MLFVTFALCGCHENRFSTSTDVCMADIESIRLDAYSLDAGVVHRNIREMVHLDNDSTKADRYLRSYYENGGRILWVNPQGVNAQIDTLLAYLHGVGEMGFKTKHFKVDEIESDLKILRSLPADENLEKIVARFDYNATKAYLKYVGGQQFGFTNPNYILNHLDRDLDDTLHVSYRKNCDLPIKQPDDSFYSNILALIDKDSVAGVLKSTVPDNPLYEKYLAKLQEAKNESERQLVMVNLEKARWRMPDYHSNNNNYVFANIPAYHVWAVNGDSIIDMKVVCGARKTKTPLLYSKIKRVEINPQWVIPSSIIRKELPSHAGDSAYFANRNYIIRDRSTGQVIPLSESEVGKFRRCQYSVVQEGGPGNSLGRIIFRFDNQFSVYMHDTPSRGTFNLLDRSASHGCIRLERPYDMAKFLLPGKSDSFLEEIETAMKESDREKVRTKNVSIQPEVPVYLGYYTLFLDPRGEWHTYPDVYGFDAALQRVLSNYQ